MRDGMTATSMIRGVAIALFACALSDARAALSHDYEREDSIVAKIVSENVVGDAVYLATPRRPRVLAIFTIPAKPIAGVVIVHGLGVHADWGLINGLRTDLADAGVATLSVQMPVLAADAPRAYYEALYPEGGELVAAGIAFMKNQGIERIAIVAHSLGAAMANAYLASQPAALVAAWIPIGMQDAFASQPKEPVLDVIGEDDWREVLAAAAARSRGLPRDTCSRQLTIAGGDHFMASRRKALSEAVVRFLETVFAGGCGP
jgi:pimeloyl-ACP methyl ester carboxylesterase